jgi:phospholipase C
VPMIVASPWSRGGWVNSQVFEHTSTLQFLEQFVKAKASKDVTESNITQFRRTVSGNLTSIFRPAEVGSKKELPFLDRDKFVESIEKAKYKEIPSNYNKLSGEQVAAYNRDPAAVPNMARQEPGIRPACALPYELYCEGEFHADKGAFALAMRAGRSVHGERSQGAPFNVYIRNAAKSSGVLERGKKNTNMFVATFAVAAGDTIQEGIPLGLFAGGRYAIDVHGPNGFYREFQGDATACPILTRCAYERTGGGLTGNVLANVRNVSSGPVKVTVADNSYKTGTQTVELAAGEMKSIPVEASKSHGWYDVTVQVSGSATHVRYAGRVETGRASMTDPLMGGVA